MKPIVVLVAIQFICGLAHGAAIETADGFHIDLPKDVEVITWPVVRERLPNAEPGKLYMLNGDNSLIMVQSRSKPIVEKHRDLDKLAIQTSTMVAVQNPTLQLKPIEIVDLNGKQGRLFSLSGMTPDDIKTKITIVIAFFPDASVMTFTVAQRGDAAATRDEEILQVVKSVKITPK